MVKRIIAVVVVLVVLVVVAGVAGYLLSDEAERGDDGEVTSKGEVSVFDLRVGDCLINVSARNGEQTDIEAVPCKQRHDGEVYTNIDLGNGDFPGDAFVAGKADRGCSARLRRQAPKSKDEIVYFVPDKQTWDEHDDRTVTCIAQHAKRRTGSLAARSEGR